MAKYSTLDIQEDRDAPKKKREKRYSTLKEEKDKDSGKGKWQGNDGVWRTVNGRHVFIEEGKTLEQALGHKPGVENQKKVEDPDKGLMKTSVAPYLRQERKNNFNAKKPPKSAYEKMHEEFKKKHRKK